MGLDQARENTELSRLTDHEMLRAVVENCPAAVYVVDEEGLVILCNRAAQLRRDCGRDGACWQPVWEVLRLAGGEPAAAKLRQALSAQAVETKELELHLLTEDDQEVPILLRLERAEVKGRQLRLLYQQDLSAQRRAEAELLQAQKMQAIGTLAGGIAHDFNNILYAITGYTEILQEDLGPEHPCAGHVDQVLNAAARGGRLIQKILAFSRPTELQRQQVDLCRLITETQGLLQDTLPANIRVEISLPTAKPTIQADYSQLQQVLLNLATNAFHATRDKGGGTIVLRADTLVAEPADGSELSPGSYGRLAVEDNGIGMSPQTAERIFEPFFTTKPPGQGSGLGLSTAHGIVESLGGLIRVRSNLGQGATFEVLLPLSNGVEPATLPTPRLSRMPFLAHAPRIMVVDDEPIISEMLCLWLGRHGHTVTQHTNPQTALEELRRAPENFDLLITDQTMPQMSGLELAKAALELRSDLPIVLATGYSDSVDEQQALACGVSAFVMKPFRLQHLALVLQKLLP